jgi:hypothetical protein
LLAGPPILDFVADQGEDYFNGDFLQDIAETRLLDLGGHALWEDARHEAGAYVDEHYPWDRAGDEPRSGSALTSPCCGSARMQRSRYVPTDSRAARPHVRRGWD